MTKGFRGCVGFPQNPIGRDYVVGDLHGCFSLLERGLREIAFDQGKDRLFSVGDLVDRGPESALALSYLKQPWFHSILGNHEAMFLAVYDEANQIDPEILRQHIASCEAEWWMDQSQLYQDEFLALIAELPLAMEIETRIGTVGIVHADVPAVLGWPSFKENLVANRTPTIEAALWARTRIRTGDQIGIDGIVHVFVGHTPLDKPLLLGNVLAIDTRAYAYQETDNPGSLTILPLDLDFSRLRKWKRTKDGLFLSGR